VLLASPAVAKRDLAAPAESCSTDVRPIGEDGAAISDPLGDALEERLQLARRRPTRVASRRINLSSRSVRSRLRSSSPHCAIVRRPLIHAPFSFARVGSVQLPQFSARADG